MIFNSPTSLNKKPSNRLKIFISGSGSEFNQGFISEDMAYHHLPSEKK